jgi:hypothetical protein
LETEDEINENENKKKGKEDNWIKNKIIGKREGKESSEKNNKDINREPEEINNKIVFTWIFDFFLIYRERKDLGN